MVLRVPILVLILFLAGCVPMQPVIVSPPPPNNPIAYEPYNLAGQAAAYATIQAREAQDAAATFQAIALRETSIAATATRDAVLATEQAQVVATGTARAATATAESQNVRATEMAMVIGATGTAVAQAGQATAQAISLNATATAEYQRGLNAEMLRYDEAIRLGNSRQVESQRLNRAKMWDRLWPWLLIGTNAFLFLLGITLVLIVWRRKPVQTVEANGRRTILIQDGQGGYRPLQQPAPALPATIDEVDEDDVSFEPRPPADWQIVRSWQDPQQVPIGVNASSGAPIIIDRNREPHLLILGSTGSGKSVSGLVPFVTAMVTAGVHAVLANGRGADFAMLRGQPNITILPQVERENRPEALAHLLRAFVQEIDRRDRVMARAGVQSWHELGNYGPGEILLCVDEFLSLIQAMKEMDRSAAGQMWRDLIVLTHEARKFGIFLALTATDPTERALGRHGLTVRNQMATLAFSMKNAAASRTILACSSRDGFPVGSVGMPIGQFVANVMGQVQHGIAFYPSAEQVRSTFEARPALPNPLPNLVADAIEDGPPALLAEPQAVADGRALDGYIEDMQSLNDVARFLLGTDERPSGQTLRDRVKPALQWRVDELGCPDASRLMSRSMA